MDVPSLQRVRPGHGWPTTTPTADLWGDLGNIAAITALAMERLAVCALPFTGKTRPPD